MQNWTHQRFPPRASTEHALWTQTLSSQKVTRKSHVRRQRQSLGDLLRRKKPSCKAQNPTSQRMQSIPMITIIQCTELMEKFITLMPCSWQQVMWIIGRNVKLKSDRYKAARPRLHNAGLYCRNNGVKNKCHMFSCIRDKIKQTKRKGHSDLGVRV